MRSRLSGLISAVTMVGSLLLASCSPTPVSPGTSPKATGPYGSLTITGTFGQGSLDLAANVGAFPSAAFLDCLVELSPEGKVVPGLAERWEISRDGMAHTFYIKKGIKFHDGSDLTGADAKFSIERMIAPESVAGGAPIWRAAIAKVELKDDYTVVLQMKAPEYDLLVSAFGIMTVVFPKKYVEQKGIDYWRKNPIGSGPFKVLRYELGNRLELEAVEGHWRATPNFKNITVLNIPEEGTRVAMLKTGELDAARVSPDSAPGLKAAGLRILAWPGGEQFIGYIFFDVQNPDKYAVGNTKVRKALALGLNRQEMIDKLYGGNGRPTTLYPVDPAADFFDPNVLKVDPYDPEQAKKLLAEAGYPNGFNTRIYDTVGRGVTTFNQAIAGYWRKIGVNADLVPIEYSGWSPKMSPKHDPEIWNSMWTYPALMNIEFGALTRTYHSTKGVPKNHTNLKLNELLGKIPTVADPVERKRLKTEAAVMAKNEYSSLPLLDTYTIMALGSKVGGLTTYPARDLDATMFATITH